MREGYNSVARRELYSRQLSHHLSTFLILTVIHYQEWTHQWIHIKGSEAKWNVCERTADFALVRRLGVSPDIQGWPLTSCELHTPRIETLNPKHHAFEALEPPLVERQTPNSRSCPTHRRYNRALTSHVQRLPPPRASVRSLPQSTFGCTQHEGHCIMYSASRHRRWYRHPKKRW